MNEIITFFQALIDGRDWKTIKTELNKLDPNQIAEIIEGLETNDQKLILFRLLPRVPAKETFQYLSHDEQEELIEGMAFQSSRITSLLNDLDPDDRTAFLEELPGKVSQRLMQLLSNEERKIAMQLLGYPEESIGRLMTPEYVAVKPYFTVSQVLEHIRRFGRDSETLNIIYVVDDHWKLIDDIRIKDILLAKADDTVSDLSDNRFVSLNAYDDQEVAVRVFEDTDRMALPVTDSDGTLVGIVTFDDIMDVATKESTEDFQKFGSVSKGIDNPLKARIGYLYKKRIGWLFALVFVNVFSVLAMKSYEEVIAMITGLVFFMPLLIDSSGNAGSQSATLMIRALSLGAIELKDWTRLFLKEIGISLLLGLTMAVGVSIVAYFFARNVIPVVAMAMVCTVVLGSVLGMLLPFIFTRMKMDPATASAPLITSIADISGVLIYFALASWYFKGLL